MIASDLSPARAFVAASLAALVAASCAAFVVVAAGAAVSTAGAQTPAQVTFTGEVRARTEWDRPGGALEEDVFTYLRTRLGMSAAPTDGVRLMFQLQDSRVYGVAASASAGNPDITDLHQAFADLDARWRTVTITTRVGRQEVALGNERLVGPVGWSNTGRTFDGARVLLVPTGADWSASLFAATVEERGRHFASAGTTTFPADRAVAGAWFTRPLRGGTLETTVLFDGGARYRSYAESDRFTLYGRYRSRTAAQFAIDAEAAWQGGTQQYAPSTTGSTTQDVSAWMVAARMGMMPAPGRRTSALIGADVLSGDAAPSDGSYHAFNTMYATNHPFYGMADLFLDPAARTNDAGLVDAFGSTTHAFGARYSLRADLHRFATQAGSGGQIGWELDVIAPVKLSSASALEVGYTGFRASAAAAAMGLGPPGHVRQWGYVQLRAGF